MTTGLEDDGIFQIIVLNHPVAGNKTSFYDEMKKSEHDVSYISVIETSVKSWPEIQ